MEGLIDLSMLTTCVIWSFFNYWYVLKCFFVVVFLFFLFFFFLFFFFFFFFLFLFYFFVYFFYFFFLFFFVFFSFLKDLGTHFKCFIDALLMNTTTYIFVRQ